FFFSSRRRHTRCLSDWSSDVCSPIYRVRVLEPYAPLGARRTAQDWISGGGERGRKRRVALGQRLQLGADSQEFLVVRADRVARCALALLDDRRERGERGHQAHDLPGDRKSV